MQVGCREQDDRRTGPGIRRRALSKQYDLLRLQRIRQRCVARRLARCDLDGAHDGFQRQCVL